MRWNLKVKPSVGLIGKQECWWSFYVLERWRERWIERSLSGTSRMTEWIISWLRIISLDFTPKTATWPPILDPSGRAYRWSRPRSWVPSLCSVTSDRAVRATLKKKITLDQNSMIWTRSMEQVLRKNDAWNHEMRKCKFHFWYPIERCSYLRKTVIIVRIVVGAEGLTLNNDSLAKPDVQWPKLSSTSRPLKIRMNSSAME